MTLKCALADLPHGGGKTVVMLPDRPLSSRERNDVIVDVGEVISGLDGRYVTGPDIGSTPEDMELIYEISGGHAFCRPQAKGGSGNSSSATARGVLAALGAAAHADPSLGGIEGLRVGVIGYGSVGRLVAGSLARSGAHVSVTDLDGGLRADAEANGLAWADGDLLTQAFDVVVPAATGGILTPATAASCTARLIVGPANNQLTDDGVATLLFDHGITWIPDVVASAGGIVHAVCREELGLSEEEAAGRIDEIGVTVTSILTDAAVAGVDPLEAARVRAAAANKVVG